MASIVNKWLNSSSAEKFFQQEQRSFQRISTSLCGQTGIQLSLIEKNNYIKDVNVSSAFKLSQDANFFGQLDQTNNKNFAIADLEALPFSSNHFAVVIAPQVNLFSEDPYAALREIYRVTASEGFVVISGINRWSLVGMQARCRPSKYPLLPTVSLGQMKVWLSLLGCDIVGGDLFHYSAMLNKGSYPSLSTKIEKIGNRWLPMMAGGYWLIAKKRLFGQVRYKPSSLKRYKTGKMVSQVTNKL